MIITDNGFIKIPRAIEKRKELQDPVNFYVYAKLLMMARFRETYIDGVDVGVNQILISKQCLADKLNIKLTQLRSILITFERIGGIRTENIRNRYTRITILPPFIDGKWSANGAAERRLPVKTEVKNFAVVDSLYEKKDEKEGNSFVSGEVTEAVSVISENNGTVISYADVMSCTAAENTDNKAVYGEFSNVRLTTGEYERICSIAPKPDYFINCLSVDIASGKVKADENHYLLIFRHIENDKKKHPENYTQKALEAAKRTRELEAIENYNRRHVPKLKKRV